MYPTISRHDLLRAFTRKEAIVEELAAYTKNKFSYKHIDAHNLFSLADEAQTSTWESYLTIAQEIGVYQLLKKYLIPFQFPIQKGISQSASYKAASLKGQSTKYIKEATALSLQKPESLALKIHQSVAGKIPVLIVPHEQDFQTIIQALAHKNEPKDIPDSMGASIISGINNWDRIHRIRDVWRKQNPSDHWHTFFKKSILPHKSLYQDKLIVLSKKPYSGVSASDVGLTGEEWLKHSLDLRLEHECAHYFTLRHLGGMYTNMHDELIADYMGITKVLGHYKSEWFLSFIGLSGKTYKRGSRLENYLGTPRLSDAAFSVLQAIMIAASENLAAFNRAIESDNTLEDRITQLITLSSLTLEQMAAPNGDNMLIERYVRGEKSD